MSLTERSRHWEDKRESSDSIEEIEDSIEQVLDLTEERATSEDKRETRSNRLRDANTLTMAPTAVGFTADHKTGLFGGVTHPLHYVSRGGRREKARATS